MQILNMDILLTLFALTIVLSSVQTAPNYFEDEEHAEIAVPRSPRIQGPQIEYLLIPFGSTIENLTCEVEANPSPKVIWLKDGVGVQQLSKPFETEFYAEEGLSVLYFPTIGPISQDFVGNFTCVAANFLGRASKSYILSILQVETENSVTTVMLSETTNPNMTTTLIPYTSLLP